MCLSAETYYCPSLWLQGCGRQLDTALSAVCWDKSANRSAQALSFNSPHLLTESAGFHTDGSISKWLHWCVCVFIIHSYMYASSYIHTYIHTYSFYSGTVTSRPHSRNAHHHSYTHPLPSRSGSRSGSVLQSQSHSQNQSQSQSRNRTPPLIAAIMEAGASDRPQSLSVATLRASTPIEQ